MMDTVNAVRQAQDMALAWAEVQKAIWERWMRGLDGAARPAHAEQWERASGEIIDAWEQTVNLALKAQLDWTALWMHELSEEKGASKEISDWSRQTYELMKAWHDAQREMWSFWFGSLRSFGPVEYTNGFVDVAKTWNEAVRKSLDASTEWVESWSARNGAQPKSNGAPEPQPQPAPT
ncbi:MAG TPA: hypothetical protein VE591_08800 [Candidatus Acidoferrum sp.]|nr:hypothetical protein [Candidatus Acidoferrum sp.]